MGVPAISISIVNYNAGLLLRDSVWAALSSDVPVEVFVCDNDSCDGSMHRLKAALRHRKSGVSECSLSREETVAAADNSLHLIENDRNYGFSAANNIALTKATAPYILLLNPDCIIRPDTLTRMLEEMHAHPEVGMAGCRILNEDGSEQKGCRRRLPTPMSGLMRSLNLRSSTGEKGFDLDEQPLPEHPTEVEAISGAFMLLRRSAIDEVGPMDEGYFLHCEDLDYCRRFLDEGWKILFVPDVEVTHYQGSCSRSRPLRVEWHKHRGMWRYYRKFHAEQNPIPFNWLVGMGVISRFILIAGTEFIRKLAARHKPVSCLMGSKQDGLFDYSRSWPQGLAGNNVLVTGATGQLGRILVAALLSVGARVSVLSRSATAQGLLQLGQVTILRGDVTDPDSLQNVCAGIDTLFHLASYPGDAADPRIEQDSGHTEVTLEGTRNLIAVACSAGVRQFIFASSVRAADIQDPLNRYAQAKLAAEQLLLERPGETGPEISILRFPALYGSSDQGSIARMLALIDRGRFPPVPEFNNRRSLLHRDDAAYALILVACSGGNRNRIYTVTDGESYSTRRLYCSINAALGRPLPTWFMPEWLLSTIARMGDILARLSRRPMPFDSQVLEKLRSSAEYDGSAFVRDTGFRPRYNLEAALPEMVVVYRGRSTHGSAEDILSKQTES